MKRNLHFALAFIMIVLFAVQSDAQTTILTQNFSGGEIPSGWSSTTLDNTSRGFRVGTNESLSWELFEIPAYTGKIAATDNYAFGDTTANINGVDRLITPALNFTGDNHVVLYFDAFFLGQFAPYPDYSSAKVIASTDGGTTWDTVQDIAGSGTWQHIAIDLSLSYAGQTNVKLAFEFDDGGASVLSGGYTGCPYGFAVGSVLVISPPDYEMAINALNMPLLAVSNNAGTGVAPISGTIQNKGGYPITSATVNWTVNGGAPQSENLTKLNIPTAATENFTLSSTVSVSTPATPYNVTVWVTNPDGQSAINGDDTVSTTVYGLSGQVQRNVLIEEATGEWCGFCPDGAYDLDTMQAAHPNILAVSLHDDGGGSASEDTLQIPDGETVVNTYISSFPGGLIDRQYYAFDNAVEQQRFGWDSLAVPQLSVTEPVTVGLYNTYDSATRTINVTVLAKLYAGAPNNYTLNVYVCEDSIRSWQHNYYSYQDLAVTGSPFYDSAEAMTAFPENRVVRAMLGGAFGTGNVIPQSGVVANTEYNTTYTYTVPKGYNTNQMFLVATVEQLDSTNLNNSPILNSVKCPLNSFSQNSVIATYYTRDTGHVDTGGTMVFYRGDSLYYNGGYIVFQLGDTVTVNGVTYIINALNDSIILSPGDQVTVTGPTGAGSTIFPQGHYVQYSFGTTSFLPDYIDGITTVNEKESLNVYPNPADQLLNLSVQLAQNSEVQITLDNVAGQRVRDMENVSMGTGTNNLTISTASLSPGVYILTVRTAQSSLSNKVVIAR